MPAGRREAVHPCIPRVSEYFAPTSLDEALSTLGRLGEDGRVLAGGQSLIPVMKLRFAMPGALVDINRIPGPGQVGEEGGAADRRARPAQDVRAVRSAARPLPAPRRRRAADLRPDRAQPRHGLRLARARRPAGRLGLRDARGAGRRSSRGSTSGERDDPDRRADPGGPVHDVAGEPGEMITEVRVPDPGRPRERHLSQAGAQGRRLRDRRAWPSRSRSTTARSARRASR